jgi:hypothetical protein
MTIFQKCGPRADLGWPWLDLKGSKVRNMCAREIQNDAIRLVD